MGAKAKEIGSQPCRRSCSSESVSYVAILVSQPLVEVVLVWAFATWVKLAVMSPPKVIETMINAGVFKVVNFI